MVVKFKNDTRSFECTEPIEQKLFKADVPAGWLTTFSIYGDLNSTEIDELVTPDNISVLSFTADAESDPTTFNLEGYSKVVSCVIRHSEAKTITELQLTKTEPTINQEGV